MGSRRNDARQAFRIFFRNPGFAAVTVLVLAVGIGAATAIFSVFSALMLRPLALPHPEQLVELSGIYRNHARIVLSYPMFRELESGQHAFAAIAGWSGSIGANVEVNGALAPAEVRSVTGNYYAVTEERPMLGRLLSEADRRGSAALPVAVVSHAFWQRRFGADPGIVGKSLRIEGRLFTVVGVSRPWSTGITVGDAPEITVPAGALENYDLSSRALLWLNVTGRLLPGVSIDQARSQILSFWPRLLEDTVPTQSVGPRRQSFLSMGLRLDPARTGVDGDLRAKVQKPLYLLLAMVGLILLLVCINLASLTLARASARSHEVSTRIALGATPWQAVRQSVMESVLLASIGAACGLALAWWGSKILVGLMTRGAEFPVQLDLRPDWRVLCFSAACAVGTGLFTGMVPAWKLSRASSAQLQPSRRTLSGGVGLLGKALIVSQIAISLVLLQGAGLFLRSLAALRSFNPGFERRSLTEIAFAPRSQSFAPVEQQQKSSDYRRELAQSVASLSGVQSAAFSTLAVPANNGGYTETVAPAAETGAASPVSATLDSISPQFFHTLAIPFVAGRDFNWTDDETHPRVAILDSLLAAQLFPHENPIGKRIRFGVQPDLQNLEVVAVVQRARLIDVHDGNAAVLYVPEAQYGSFAAGGNLLVRERSGVPLDKAVAGEFLSFGKEYVVSTHTYDEKSDEALVFEQMTARLSSFFAGVALLVAAAGLFGLMSYAVTLRTREIGIRMALGSQRGAIQRLIVREAVLLTLAGIAIGIPGALVAGRLVSRMLFELSSADPVTLLSVSLTLLAAGIAAGYLPARRAMQLDPMVALRQE
jgi:predicted permease